MVSDTYLKKGFAIFKKIVFLTFTIVTFATMHYLYKDKL